MFKMQFLHSSFCKNWRLETNRDSGVNPVILKYCRCATYCSTSFFLSWVANTLLNHWTKRVVSTWLSLRRRTQETVPDRCQPRYEADPLGKNSSRYLWAGMHPRAQYLRSHLDQLPLLRLRTQAISYIPSHLHLANDHTYTPYDQRYCPSCLPIQICG